MRHSFPHWLVCWSLLVTLVASGCNRKLNLAPSSGTPTVVVSKPIERKVVDFVEFTGRTDAIVNTDVRPRVTGYLVGMPFKEGALVKKDDILFEIDDRPYKADLDLAKGSLEAAKAAVIKTQADYDIGLNVQKNDPGAISVQEISKRLGSRDEAKGNLDKAKGALETAQLNYDWCKVRSPIDGQTSRYKYTLGNLVRANETELTTVVTQDPIYVYFDVDENTMLYVLRHIILPSKEDLLAKKDAVPVEMGLADEQGFPHKGHVNFGNNVVNPSTGTILIRGVFDNPANSAGKRLLRPGMFVRVRLPLGKPHDALLVSEKAIGTDQGQKYLLIVDDKKTVDYRRVTTGALQDDGLRVVEKGLKPGEWVIVSGLQMVRPRMEVATQEEPMPVLPVKGQEPASEDKGSARK